MTGRRIGLDSLRVERGFDTDLIRQDPGLIAEDTDPSTRLTMSKRLRSDVEVILSQDLRQSGGISAAINYRPFRSVELRAVQRDNSDRTFAVRHEITFGGGRAAVRSREAAEVASIAFDGAGPDEAALRDRLRLKVGKRFDFVRWRDDVDRLERWLRERGRLEARVRASRGDIRGRRRADLPRGVRARRRRCRWRARRCRTRCGAGSRTPGPTASSIASCWRNCAAKWRSISSTATSSARPSRPP